MNYIEQLKIDEGFRGNVYLCTSGKNTIAYGRNLDDNPITKEEGEILLLNDIQKIKNQLKNDYFFQKLDDERKGAIINMCFNLGYAGLMKFKNMISAIEVDDYTRASEEMLNSKWAEQVGDRANRLADIIRG